MNDETVEFKPTIARKPVKKLESKSEIIVNDEDESNKPIRKLNKRGDTRGRPPKIKLEDPKQTRLSFTTRFEPELNEQLEKEKKENKN